MSADNLDQEVSTAILYFMFSIAYFVTTTTCFSGANALKHKLNNQSASIANKDQDCGGILNEA